MPSRQHPSPHRDLPSDRAPAASATTPRRAANPHREGPRSAAITHHSTTRRDRAPPTRRAFYPAPAASAGTGPPDHRGPRPRGARRGQLLPAVAVPSRAASLTRPPGRSGEKMRVNADNCYSSLHSPPSTSPTENPKAPATATNPKKSPPLPSPRPRVPKPSSRFRRSPQSSPPRLSERP